MQREERVRSASTAGTMGTMGTKFYSDEDNPKRRSWRPKVFGRRSTGSRPDPEGDVNVTVETITAEEQQQQREQIDAPANDPPIVEKPLEKDQEEEAEAPPNALGTTQAHDSTFVPGIIGDEDAGILAMVKEIQGAIVVPCTSLSTANASMKKAMIQLFDVLVAIASPVRASTNEMSRVIATDNEYSIAAMFKEMGDSIPKTNPKEYMDALLAKILHKSYDAAKERSGEEEGEEVVEDVDVGEHKQEEQQQPDQQHKTSSKGPIIGNLDILALNADSITIDEDDDVSLVGMFKEVAKQLPGMKEKEEAEEENTMFKEVAKQFPGMTEKEAEEHMTNRLTQVWDVAAKQRSSKNVQSQSQNNTSPIDDVHKEAI